MTWQDDGACVGMLNGLFDPLSGQATVWTKPQKERVLRALTVCSGCPVLARCGSEGVRGRHSGVWGGRMLVDGRKIEVPTSRSLTPCGTETSWTRHRRHGEICETCNVEHARKVAARRDSKRRSDQRRRRAGVA